MVGYSGHERPNGKGTFHKEEPRMSESPRKCPALKAVLGGVVVGALLLAGLAWGMRVTDARPFCSSCHVMGPEAVTHKMSTHANLTCNECHAPEPLLSKLPFKAKEGFRDVYVNMLGTIPEPLLAGRETREVVNTRCRECHALTNINVASMESKPYCTDCHRGVAHMRKQPISTRMVADE